MDDFEADDVNHNGGAKNRESKKYYCGFLSSELIGIFFSVFLPLSDAWSDVAVIVSWYIADQMNWFVIGVIIHLIAGTLSGCLLAAWELSPRSNGIMATCWFPLGMVLGVLGLSPVASALVALSDGGKDAGRERIERDFFFLKSIKAVELLFESLPQSAVQAYVGVSYGFLDPGAGNFSPILAVSVAIALVSAGTTLMGTEAMGRNLVLSDDYHRISLLTVYGALTATWRFTQVSAFILWLSLFACYAKGWAAIPATVGVLTLGAMVWEAGFERSDPDTQGVGKPKCLQLLHLFNIAGMCFFFFFSGPIPIGNNLYWGPQANNYLNQSAVETDDPSDPQFFDCQARTSVVYPAIALTVVSVFWMQVSLNYDPQHGTTWMKEISDRLQQEETERRFLTRADFEFEREYRLYMRATLNRKGGVHQGVAVRLLTKVETYNSDTEQTHVMPEDTVGTYKPSGEAAGSIHARKFGDEDAVLGGACVCEWSGAEMPLKGQTIPVDYAFVEIITPYNDVHYDIIASDVNPTFDDDDEDE